MSTRLHGVRQFGKSVAVTTASSAWSLLPLRFSRTLLALARLDVHEPVEVSEKGAVCCISVDFDATKGSRFELNRRGTKSLVGLSMRHAVPMTWAVCGMTAEEDPASYEMVLNSGVPHEIAVHTYSHADVSKCSEGDLVREVERCVGVLGLGEMPRTFVFPWNREAHHDVLARLGFTAFRGERRGIGMPSNSTGLWNVRPVCYLGSNSFESVPFVHRLIDLCVSARTIFHMWFHPWSVASPSSDRYEVSVLEPIFAHIERLKESGLLEVMTMGEIARRLDAGHGPFGGAVS